MGIKLRNVIFILFMGLFLTVLSFLPTVVRAIGWASPEWSLILVVFLAFRSGILTASVVAFALGCFHDALTVSPEGLESLSLLSLVIIVSLCSELVKVNNFFLMALLAMATLIKNTIFIPGFLSLMGLYQGLSSVTFFECLVKALVTGLVTVPVMTVLDFLGARVERQS
jgi:rod shape-determining protein MreD